LFPFWEWKFESSRPHFKHRLVSLEVLLGFRMTRKPIPDSVQSNVLLKSRRRCCLCFWLDGRDEVVKGQIAHLDQDHTNASEDNLAFLCYDHHDEYDGRTSTSKGLKQSEVRKWRDELYREMEYRFRTARSRDLSLSSLGFILVGPKCDCTLRFRLTNIGESEVRGATVSIRLPDHIRGEVPKRDDIPVFDRVIDLFGMEETRNDMFEPNGRVGIIHAQGRPESTLLTGHSVDFEGLGVSQNQISLGSELSLDCRVDAEQMRPVMTTIRVVLSRDADWQVRDVFQDDEPDEHFLQVLGEITGMAKRE
jgi:hypothetical protein